MSEVSLASTGILDSASGDDVLTLNVLLGEEADRLRNARRYERLCLAVVEAQYLST